MLHKMRYRLGLDLGSTSIGWALVRLDTSDQPCAVIKTGVRIFSDGRNPKDGSSLAVTRRKARAMRRRRDRFLRRRCRMLNALIQYGFFPSEKAQRKALELLDPYFLRAKGLNEALTPGEFGRALFHINQRRGFKSNRKTDQKNDDSSVLKTAITRLRNALASENCRTVGEWLNNRHKLGWGVRARYREKRTINDDGKTRINKNYDLYVDRAMIEQEFDVLWKSQSEFNPVLFNEAARIELKDILLYQRPLKPIRPGRCTFIPDEERAPMALPSVQRFRLYQEVNNLRILGENLKEETLTLKQRDDLVGSLERYGKRTFPQIKKLLGMNGSVQFNLEDQRRQELKGNITNAILSKDKYFGEDWFSFSEEKQDEIVLKLCKEENMSQLISWLRNETDMDEERAEAIANVGLPEGYGGLCKIAIDRILPELRREVITYDKAVIAAGFEHHSHIGASVTGEVLLELPYYGRALQRHVGFGSNDPQDKDEKRYGRIANPTVHVCLNQVRLVVNALIKRYGHPSEVIVEVARDLKQSKDQRNEENKRQAENQKRNRRLRAEIARILNVDEERVRNADIQKMILWEELGIDPADRRCPYSGTQISVSMLLSDEVEVEHILPFSQTLDDSLINKTVCLRLANRAKGNRTPWDAFGAQNSSGFDYSDILERAERMPKAKRYRFGEDGYRNWLKDDAGFLARALNDTRYMSRVAKEYLSLICPHTRVIPGRMTALLRAKLGLNGILGLSGEKNRNDHRHHAVDACVIAVTDQGLLQRFASASASSRESQLDRLVANMPLPWESYREHVERAIRHTYTSHKPDHGHEGAMHNDTAYGLLGDGKIGFHKVEGGQRIYIEENLKVIEIADTGMGDRHGFLPNGEPRPYKGYKGDSNYCIEIIRDESGKWKGNVISTYMAYQIVRKGGIAKLRDSRTGFNGESLVMRLMIDDTIRLYLDEVLRVMRVTKLSSNGQVFMADINEANVDARNRNKEDPFSYISKKASSLQLLQARCVTISPTGKLQDPGFRG